jgi:uncharacterized protein YjaZ
MENKTINILGFPFKIKYKSMPDNNGLASPDFLTIFIDKDIPAITQKAVLLHEIIHCLSALLSLHLSEHQVTVLTSGLYQVLKNNKDIL